MARFTSRTGLVVGAGVGGLTAAIGLSRAGWQVEIADRGAALDTRGATLGIWPAAWRGLERLGVTEYLTDYDDYLAATIRSPAGRILGHLPLAGIARRQGLPVRLVTRPALMYALKETLQACDIPPIRFGTTFDGERKLAPYELVVGADGINSRVRDQVSPAVLRSLEATAWRGSCVGRSADWGEIWGRGMFAGMTPAGKGRTNWYVAVADSLLVDDRSDLRARLSDWPADLRQCVDATDDATILRHPLFDLPALPAYYRDRFVLVGDAAHAMAPSLGQGACQAILDGLKLAECLRDVPSIAEGLAAYDQVQRPAGNVLVKRSRRLLRAQLSPGMAPARNALLHLTRPLAPR